MKAPEAFEVGFLNTLVTLGVVSAEDAVAILKAYDESDVDQFEDFLLSEDIVDEEHILQALSEYYKVPSFDVLGYFFERHYLEMFPKDVLLRNEMIPLDVDENMMIVIASRPDDSNLPAIIGQYVSYDIRFYVGIGRDICDSVEEFYEKADTEEMQDEDLNEEHIMMGEFHFLAEEEGEEEDLEEENKEAEELMEKGIRERE